MEKKCETRIVRRADSTSFPFMVLVRRRRFFGHDWVMVDRFETPEKAEAHAKALEESPYQIVF